MAYGVKNGAKLPGEYNLADKLGFALAGALGIVVAVMMDMQQSDEASALYFISKWFSWFSESVGLGPMPLYAVILVLMGVGVGAVYYFQPVTMQGAFAQGFGALAALMTVAPSNLGAPLDAPDMPMIQQMQDIEDQTAQSGRALGGVEAQLTSYTARAEGSAMLQQAVYTGTSIAGMQPQPVAFQRGEDKYNLTIEIMLPNGLKEDADTMIRRGTMRGRLFNADNGQAYNLFRTSGAIVQVSPDERRMTLMTSVTGQGATANLKARVEVDGYAITVESFTASAGRDNNWRISMTPSNTPLFMQRFRQSYSW